MSLYLLDNNVISDLIMRSPAVRSHVAAHLAAGDSLGLCYPIYYELLRGLFWRNATSKLAVFNSRLLPLLTWVPLEDTDWEQAAHFWADATRKGRQLADPDLLLAALAYRLGAVLVSSDRDFEVLPILREDWRQA
jgi:predicted nucleic acid-binding protein